jgi:hypothetical protein
MNNKWDQYRAKNTKKSNNDKWAQYHSSNFKNDESINEPKNNEEEQPPEEHLGSKIFGGYPIEKIAEFLQNHPGLNKAANKVAPYAEHFNRAVEGAGFPSIARGAIGSGIDIGRGISNLIPGVNIEAQEQPELNVNPYWGKTLEIGGSFAGPGKPVYEGYQLAKKGLGAIPGLKHIPESIRSILAGAGVGSAISPEHRTLGAGIGAAAEAIPAAIKGGKEYINARNPNKHKSAMENALSEYEASKAAEHTLKQTGSHNFGANDPERLIMKSEDMKKQLQDAIKERQGIESPDLSHNYPRPNPEHLINTHEQNVQGINEQISNYLQHGAPNDEALAKHIADTLEGERVLNENGNYIRRGGLKGQLGNEFEAIDNSFEGQTVEMPFEPTEKQINELLEIANKGANADIAGNSTSLASFKKQAKEYLIEKEKGTKVDAQKLYKKYRTLTMEATSDRSKAFAHGIDPEASDKWKGIAAAKQAEATRLEPFLEKVNPEAFKRLKAVKDRWHKEYAPLRENPIYNEAVEHGRISTKDIPGALRGHGFGKEQLKENIQNNPNASRLVAAHQFSGNPEGLQNLNQTQRQYINESLTPELHGMIESQRNAIAQRERAHQTAEQWTQENKNVEATFKESQKRQNEIKNLETKIPKFETDIKEARKLSARLKEASEEKGLSKLEFEKRKLAYDNSVMKLEKTKSRLTGIATGILGTIGTGATILAAESALGRDWKKDAPLLAALIRTRKHRKK